MTGGGDLPRPYTLTDRRGKHTMTTKLRNVKQGEDHCQPVQSITATGQVITIQSGTVLITKPSSAATGIVLGTPDPADDGMVLRIVSTTAEAHTVLITTGLGGAGSGADVATFGGAIFDGMLLMASAGTWIELEADVNITYA